MEYRVCANTVKKTSQENQNIREHLRKDSNVSEIKN